MQHPLLAAREQRGRDHRLSPPACWTGCGGDPARGCGDCEEGSQGENNSGVLHTHQPCCKGCTVMCLLKEICLGFRWEKVLKRTQGYRII